MTVPMNQLFPQTTNRCATVSLAKGMRFHNIMSAISAVSAAILFSRRCQSLTFPVSVLVQNRRQGGTFVSRPFSSASPRPKASPSSRFAQQEVHQQEQVPLKVNIHTISQDELETLLKSWGHPQAFRAKQIMYWVRKVGATTFEEMNNIPKKLRQDLEQYATIGSLKCVTELKSKDGTIKRLYALHDNQNIESVLMPYTDGRYTACISSQAGCAMGCVFCATGQMGFARQLSAEEIFEQVARFDAELAKEKKRVSNVVMMGMGEPLANYKNVMSAIRRMNDELGIGARKITISTVGVVPSIRKLMDEDIQVRLAVSLHCATDEERTKLIPANRRYGGLAELMTAVREYAERAKRRVTFEWALIEQENDSPEVARTLGNLLIKEHGLRRDHVHINVIPLNPTGGYGGSPSGRTRVNAFVKVLQEEFGISATPRVRRGIDIDAGCGQLKTKVEKKERKEREEALKVSVAEEALMQGIENLAPIRPSTPIVGVYEDYEEDNNQNESIGSTRQFLLGNDAVDFDERESEDEYFDDEGVKEAERLMALAAPPPIPAIFTNTPSTATSSAKAKTTTITDEATVKEAKKRRKKLVKHLNMIDKLKAMEQSGNSLNEEQKTKVSKELQWRTELESVEHNLQ